MKKYYALAILLLLCTTSYAQRQLTRYKEPKQSKVDRDVWNVTINERLLLRYLSKGELMEEFEKEAKLKMWTAAQREEELQKVPAGGALAAKIARGSIEEANPDKFLIVLQDASGKEVARFTPASQTPTYITAGVWAAPLSVGLATVPASGTKVFIIDQPQQVRFEYELRPLN